MQDIHNALKNYFGYDIFRPGQREVIDTILARQDVLAVMPTGSGKSVCYQLPALLLDGITIVISPLISLMRDQVSALGDMGIRAAYLNSTLTPNQCRKALENASAGMYKIIYVAPERLLTRSFSEFAKNANISLLAIDESHCVSEWGHDFRPSYLDIASFVAGLKSRPTVAAFTATATEQVKNDIIKLLQLDAPRVFTTGYDRPGLYFGVVNTGDKLKYILDFIKRRADGSGIIYCLTRRNADRICDMLVDRGIDAVKYHAGLTEQERSFNQDEFVYDRCKVIVATNAFGMGIDKSNVSYVIHYNMPMSIESYYQEAGRAGRDGSDAECVLLFDERDVKLGEYIINHSVGEQHDLLTEAEVKQLKKINIEKLHKMARLCRTHNCLRADILEYFGEKYNGSCNKCSVCLKKNAAVTLDSAKAVIGSAILKTGGRFGAVAVTDLLSGRKNQKFIGRGYDKLYEFGIMRFTDKEAIRRMIDTMLDEGLLIKTAGEYSVLKVTDKFVDLYNELPKTDVEGAMAAKEYERSLKPDQSLFAELKAWRKSAAYRMGVPPYVIFNDMTLSHIASIKPKSTSELLRIQGMSKQKCDRYGAKIIKIIKEHK